jgi:hypothetical protein
VWVYTLIDELSCRLFNLAGILDDSRFISRDD